MHEQSGNIRPELFSESVFILMSNHEDVLPAFEQCCKHPNREKPGLRQPGFPPTCEKIGIEGGGIHKAL